MRPTRRGRRGPRAGLGWLSRTGCVAAAVLLFSAYGSGVSWGHWTLAARAATSVGTGHLEVAAAPLPDFAFDCTARTYSGKGISFVRFWDPLYLPGELVPAKPGAVKIEEDGVELGAGPYWVEPAGAVLGDPITVHLGEVTVQIVSWAPKPGEPGEWVAFGYAVSPAGAKVTADVKAGQSLTRWALSGSGVWTAAGPIPGGGAFDCSCGPSSRTARLDFANTGSIPAAASLRWVLGSGADPAACAYFDVAAKDGPSGGSLFQGSLCDLLGVALALPAPLDQGGATWLEVAVSVREGACPAGEVALPLASETTFWQWTSSFPGTPGAYGWWGTAESPFQVGLSVSGEPCGSAAVPEGGFAAAPALLPGEPARAPEEPARALGEPARAAGEPAAASSTTTAAPAAGAPLEGPPATTTTTTALLPPGEPVRLTLQGRVWEDRDGDGVTVTDPRGVLPPGFEVEPAVAGVQVTLWAEDGRWVAATLTDEEGLYEFRGLPPGVYRAEFRAPEGFGFRDPEAAITAEAGPLAAGLGIPVEQVVFDDLALAPEPGEGESARAETGWFALDEAAAEDGGETDGPADAALVRLPGPEEGAGEDGAGGGEVPGPIVDPNTHASPPEEPGLAPPDGEGGGEGGDGGGGTAGGGEVPSDHGGTPGGGEVPG